MARQPLKHVAVDFVGEVSDASPSSRQRNALTLLRNYQTTFRGRLEPRLGHLAKEFGTPRGIQKFATSPVWGDNMLIFSGQRGGGAVTDQLYYGDGVTVLTNISPLASEQPAPPDFVGDSSDRVAVARANNSNTYFTQETGVMRVESDLLSTTTCYFAGVARPPGLDQTRVTGGNFGVIDAATVGYLAANNWLSNNQSVAYRVTWILTDADGRVMESAPSGRWVITNSAGAARAIRLRAYLPRHTRTLSTAIAPTGTHAWKLRVYRTAQILGTPSDEMQLAGEFPIVAADVTAGYVEVIDATPDGLLTGPLYTNSVTAGDINTLQVKPGETSAGILASNDIPPLAAEVSFFKQCMFYGCIERPTQFTFSILSVGAAGGISLKAGDIITINGTAFTAVAAAPGANQFLVTVGGTATSNIRATAIALVEAINSTVYAGVVNVVATYTGSDASIDAYGRILLETIYPGTITIQVTTGSGVPYAPQLGTAQTIQAERLPNTIAFSKPDLPDAVPPVNSLAVGAEDNRVKRMVATNDVLWIFTEQGLYMLRGNTPADFALDLFDSTCRLVGRETAVMAEEAVYALTTRGFVRITTAGVETLGDNQIQRVLLDYLANTTIQAVLERRAMAAVDEQRRQIYFWLPNTSSYGGVAACQQGFLLSLKSKLWSQLDTSSGGTSLQIGACTVRPSDRAIVVGTNTVNTTGYIAVQQVGYYNDEYAFEANDSTTRIVEWTPQIPSEGSTVDWVEFQAVLDFDASYPTAIGGDFTLTFTGDNGTTASVNDTITQNRIRCLVPTTVKLGRSLKVRLSSTSVFGVESLILYFNPVSEMVTR